MCTQGTQKLFSIGHTGAAGATYVSLETIKPDYLEIIEARIKATITGGTNPTLDAVIQSTHDDESVEDANAIWTDLLTFTQLTATGNETKSVNRYSSTEADTLFGRRLRLKLTAATDSGATEISGAISLIGLEC